MDVKISKELKEELSYWGFEAGDILDESLEYVMWATVRRKTDNLCRECKKPIESSIPKDRRVIESFEYGFCDCMKS